MKLRQSQRVIPQQSQQGTIQVTVPMIKAPLALFQVQVKSRGKHTIELL